VSWTKTGLVCAVAVAPDVPEDVSSTNENFEKVEVNIKNNNNRKMTSINDVIDNRLRRRALRILM
jgi:hypothetical protein